MVMHKNQLLFILIICLFSLNLKAQKADLEYINSAAEIRFNLDIDSIDLCDSYVMNGIFYTAEEFKTELLSYKQSDIKFTAIVDLRNTTWFHRKCDYMILVGAGEYGQARESKLKELDSIRANLNDNLPELVIRDYICKNCKQVVVNGTPIGMYEARTFVNELKIKNIDFIVSYESANPSVFGRNSVNGLTEIFLKKKADNRR
jgi:hypothetical protein